MHNLQGKAREFTRPQRPQIGEIWRARDGTIQEVIKLDDIDSEILPAAHIRNKDSGAVNTVCLDGREAIMGWGSPLDLLERISPAKCKDSTDG